MERIITKNKNGDIACNNIIIYTSKDESEIGKSIRDSILTDFKIIKPKYYKHKDDNCLIEIWYDKKGIVLDNGCNRHIKVGRTSNWNVDFAKEITYEEAMYILDKEQRQDLGYNNKDLMQRVEDELEKENKFFDDRKFPFWLKVISGHERPIGTIFYVKDELTRYKKKDVELYTGYVPSFTEDDLIEKLRGTEEKLTQKDYTLEDDKQNNNGGASDWYSLPKNANTLQDLIEHRNMNGSVKDIFKACYRLGIKTEDELRDLNKMAYYSLREVGRITGRKDYVTIAKELMGEQSIEKHKCNDYCNHDDDEDLV